MCLLYFDGMKILKDIVGRNKSVFEPACGYGRMKRHLYPDCAYSGIDLNRDFIRYGKRKNRDIGVGNVFDVTLYRQADVIMLCDILHHLKVKDIRRLLGIAVRFAREKVVIVEPTFVKIASKNNFFSRVAAKLMASLDADGINDIDHWMSREEYDRLFFSLKEENYIGEMKIRHFRNHDFVEMLVDGSRPAAAIGSAVMKGLKN
jgi:SAM-dependent methyltransferase